MLSDEVPFVTRPGSQGSFRDIMPPAVWLMLQIFSSDFSGYYCLVHLSVGQSFEIA
jgi:hypothetical protein